MTSLFVDRRNVHLELDGNAIVFRENGERIGTVPLAPLSRVFLRGDIVLSASLLGKLGEHNVGVVVLSGRQGKPTLLLARPHNDASRRVAQIKNSLDEAFTLDFARALIERKLERQIAWFDELRETNLQYRYELTHAMKLLKEHRQRLPSVKSAASLRGVEGSAAARYFDGLKAVVPPALKFHARNRRPPRDPFNAILSLSYTLAVSELSIALYGAGFDPYVGFYHQLDFGRESLSCDLLEPIRPIVDTFALQLFRQGKLSADDFSSTESGCFLGKAGRVRYYGAYEAASENLRAGINLEIERLGRAMTTTESAQDAARKNAAPSTDADAPDIASGDDD
ncbi:MAG TPA: CRISPR-associated endonuclease Cas1 [Rhodocyclaceae bacterium]|nr:CRISPR-associated endonuclease Cas1 [Rhodocyclaceae bacterium]